MVVFAGARCGGGRLLQLYGCVCRRAVRRRPTSAAVWLCLQARGAEAAAGTRRGFGPPAERGAGVGAEAADLLSDSRHLVSRFSMSGEATPGSRAVSGRVVLIVATCVRNYRMIRVTEIICGFF